MVGALAAEACFTAPPPNLPELTDPRPTILTDAVQPPEGTLAAWPTEFIVPVQVDLSNETFVYNVFVDYLVNQEPQRVGPPTSSGPDGGPALVKFSLQQPDTAFCPHRIEFLVAEGFNMASQHTPNSFGGDIATWSYVNGGAGACPAYDAGDGAFPDVAADGLLVVPESGSDP